MSPWSGSSKSQVAWARHRAAFLLSGGMNILKWLGLVAFLWGQSVQAQEYFVYFGTYTGAKSKGIYLSRFDTGTGKLSTPELAAETRNPSFLAVHPTGKFL